MTLSVLVTRSADPSVLVAPRDFIYFGIIIYKYNITIFSCEEFYLV